MKSFQLRCNKNRHEVAGKIRDVDRIDAGKSKIGQCFGKYLKFALVSICLVLSVVDFPLADVSGAVQIRAIMQTMIDIVGMIFQAVGVILTVYAIGTLVMAFKNEDPDAKSRAGTMLVVGVVLMILPAIIKGLNLTSYIGA